MANKNFEVKHGLSVGGTERISTAGVITGSLASATTATTQSALDNSTKIATTAYTDAAITAVIGGAPGTLDTLNELAAAINDDASYASTLTTALATKAPLASPAFTGTVTSGNITSSGQIMTTQEGANSLKTRFLMGKDSGNTNNGDLYINYGSSHDVHIGAGGTSDLTVAGSITAGPAGVTTQDHRVPTGTGYITYSPSNQTADVLNIRRYGTVQQKFDQYGVTFPAGNVGIGTVSPQGLLDLTVPQAKTATGGATFAQLGKTNESSNYASLQCEVKGGSSAADRKWTFQTIEQGVANAGSIVLQPDGGNVGIGISSPSTYDSRANNLVVGDSGDSGITIFSGATRYARLQFAPSGSTGLDNGLVQYDNNDDSMVFATGGTDRVRIDSNGVLTSKSHIITGIDNNAFEVKTNHSGNPSAVRVAGAGSINGISGSFQNFTVLNVMQDSGALNSIYAAGNIKTDGNINIGTSGKGISFSATGDGSGSMSSELLDDYEEGTWTPVIKALGGNNATYTNNNTNYTKIGRLCHITAYIHSINLSAITSGSYLVITGLPYAATGYGDFTISYRSGGWTDASTAIVGGYVQSGQSLIYLMAPNGVEAQQTGSFAISKMMINVTYAVA